MKVDNSFKQEVHEWADRTADFYHEKAKSDKKYDIAFYTQSNLTEIVHPPELLILAINPGSGGKYEDQISNVTWKRWGLIDRMDGATLLKGNPMWEERNKWRFWLRLNNIFTRGGIKDILQDKSRFVWSNLTLFATKKEKDLPKLLNECAQKTVELIDVLRPIHILCLGGDGCIKPLKTEIKFEAKELLPFNLLSFGKYNGISIYSIKHTASRPAFTIEEMNLIGKCLKYFFENPGKDFTAQEIEQHFVFEIDAVKKRKTNSKMIKTNYSLIKKEVSEEISSKLGEIGINNYDRRFPERYLLTENMILTVTKREMGYIAIRHKDYSKNYKDKEYSNQIALMNLLRDKMGYNDKHNNAWLGVKHFTKYGSTTNEIILNILQEMRILKIEIDKIMSN